VTGFEAVKMMEALCKGFHSTEKHGMASNRELRQWLNDGAIAINGTKPKPNDDIGESIHSFVLFPKHDNKRRTVT
jgi:hypothetical protein